MAHEGNNSLVIEAPARDTRTARAPSWLHCAQCGHRVTSADSGTEFDGGHAHRFINPSGLHFHIRLFTHAPGCNHEGEPTEYFSWFPGYAWQVAMCGQCRAHLGWAFHCIGPPGPGEPEGFHGLIVQRLTR